MKIAVCTTFADEHFDQYAKQMLQSFVTHWPEQIPILVQTDTPKYAEEINKIIRPQDGLKSGWEPDHAAFVERNKGKDDPNNYRKQAVRFCHKVFALKYALKSVNEAKATGAQDVPRYLVWMDADVLTTRKVTIEELAKCMPKDGDAVAYLGRKDWDHSECGWLAFDLDNGGEQLIEAIYDYYRNDKALFALDQWHDSFVFDKVCHNPIIHRTNLTPDATGMEVWPQSPMAPWSRHYKGPIAKQELVAQPQESQNGMRQLKIVTTNSLPNENIQKNILENQAQIKNWINLCLPTEEEIVVASAGPLFLAEDLEEEVKAGRKIVAVKHALKRLQEANIKPWACILLDPRDHVYDFVDNPDKDILWFVASQVTPKAVKKLLDSGCEVWGYHASVGAGEAELINRQPGAVVSGGSATATRGLFVLDRLGFKKFRLYGYDLCFGNKPDLKAKDQYGQPKNFEIQMQYKLPYYGDSRWFWSEGQLLAQAEEFKQILGMGIWKIKVLGYGIAQFLYNIHRINDLRMRREVDTLRASSHGNYEDMLGCKKKARFSTRLPKTPQKTRRKRTKASSS